MASLQNQTYANTGEAYYIKAGVPVVPGDTAITGPIEVAPALSEGSAVYYNQFTQKNIDGLQISENKTAGNVLLSDIRLTSDAIQPATIKLSTYQPTAQATSLTLTSEFGQGVIKTKSDAGLVVGDKSGSGTSLQLYHDPANNRNVFRNYLGGGAELSVSGNTGDIVVSSPLSASSITVPSTAEYIIVSNNGSPLRTNQLLNNGIVMNEGSTYGGRLGTLGGTGMTLDSKTNITLRTNYGTTPLTNITCNTDGSVTFLNTITALIGSFLTSVTTPLITAVTGAITTLNSTTANITTGNITTLNSTTINNTGLTTTGTLTVNTTASIPNIINLATINTLPLSSFFVPVGCVLPWAGIQFNGVTIPAGFLLCNGTYYNKVGIYANLYNVIGDTYGAYSATQFTVPDMRTKTVFGASEAVGTGDISFIVVGATFSLVSLGTNITPINPATGSPYPSRQVLQVTSVETGYNLVEGQLVVFGSNSKYITGIINYDGTPGGGKNIVVILDSPLNTDVAPGNNFTVTDQSNGFNLTRTRYGNYTNQLGREVGIHTHGSVATGSSANAGAANQRSEPTFSSPINQPNGNFTINSVAYQFPYSANNVPSCVFMNYIIKY